VFLPVVNGSRVLEAPFWKVETVRLPELAMRRLLLARIGSPFSAKFYDLARGPSLDRGMSMERAFGRGLLVTRDLEKSRPKSAAVTLERFLRETAQLVG